MRTIIINVEDELLKDTIKHLDKFLLDYPNSTYQVISLTPNCETLESIQDVDSENNYETITLKDLEPPTN